MEEARRGKSSRGKRGRRASEKSRRFHKKNVIERKAVLRSAAQCDLPLAGHRTSPIPIHGRLHDNGRGCSVQLQCATSGRGVEAEAHVIVPAEVTQEVAGSVRSWPAISDDGKRRALVRTTAGTGYRRCRLLGYRKCKRRPRAVRRCSFRWISQAENRRAVADDQQPLGAADAG